MKLLEDNKFKIVLLAIALLVAYVALYWPLNALIERSAIALALIPVMVLAYAYGPVAGIVAALAAIPVNLGLLTLSGYPDLGVYGGRNFFVAHATFVVAGAIVGYLRRLRYQLEQELEERRRVEKQLNEERGRLEERVRERTEQLDMALAQLTTVDRLKDEFIANITHEFRTPLTNLKLYINLLTQRPDKLEEYATTLEREAGRLEQNVEQLLYLSSLVQAKAHLNRTEVKLDQLVKALIEDRKELAVDHKISMCFESDVELPEMQVDAVLIERVLGILLDNALAYTPQQGTITVCMVQREEDDRQWAGFAVKDTGPGIPKDEQDRIFERFFRGVIALATSTPGTGLGLSIAQNIAEWHGGRIELDSGDADWNGATFTVWLPVEE